MDMIHVAPGDYDRYEFLVLQKEQYENDADQYWVSYIEVFGEQIANSFDLKIQCIALKKEIALHIAAQNKGKTLTREEIAEYMTRYMAAYRDELSRMLADNEMVKNSKPISSYAKSQIKSIYRRLAKMLHPDISPLTAQNPLLAELFTRIINAYNCNDLKGLQELEVLVNKELKEKGITDFNMIIPDISDRIHELEEDIDRIISTEPYTYKKLLEDPDAVAELHSKLEEEINTYSGYKAELEIKLAEIKKGT